MAGDMVELISASVISGTSCGGLVLAGLRVHIQYLREIVQRHEQAIQRAHERIDQMQRELTEMR